MHPILVALACLLSLVHTGAVTQSAGTQRGLRRTSGRRDTPALAQRLLVQRARGWRTIWGGSLYLGARLAYLPLSAGGVFLWRTLAWTAALIGIALLLVAVLWP